MALPYDVGYGAEYPPLPNIYTMFNRGEPLPAEETMPTVADIVEEQGVASATQEAAANRSILVAWWALLGFLVVIHVIALNMGRLK